MNLEKSAEISMDWPTTRLEGNRLFFADISGKLEAMKSNSHRMFVSSDAIDVEACQIDKSGCKPAKISSVGGLVKYLENVEKPGAAASTILPASEIFFIRQPHSRARFAISEPAAKLLFSRLSILPTFGSILTCFGVENGPCAEGRSGFYEDTRASESGSLTLDTGYILKHVEGKPGSQIPWSIRQMGIYQSYSTSTKTSSSLLLQSSARVQKFIFDLAQDGGITQLSNHWTHLHEIYLGTMSSGWTDYIKLLDEKVSDIENDVRFTRREMPSRVTFTTLQHLSKYSDLLIRILHALQLNISILERLSETAIRRQNLDVESSSAHYEAFQDSLRTCLTEQHFLKHHAGLVLNCAQEITALVRNIVTLADSDVMLTLTQKTIQEAQTMKTITFVALIYLPASFVATFLSMGFLHIESVEGTMRLNVSKDMWFFLILTVPLMLITLLGWWLWELIIRRRANAAMKDRDEEG
ncbi:hypothetical protein L207DRAFT_300392 [Hyaloscypha variabilis F]|uniref:CorA-like transporter domain-containing protein n=1 Tax=Hyaloscypha variabilis (strain UAMH 11265 / GT02V1 / F) TaxID=1149755 RepID=A0A2J6RYI5_HYAVF|nr:hypothetical protein L207DRAFT_300392 [Hyaloscypha variabilis F]